MTAVFRSWWQQIKHHPVAFGFAGIILAVAIALIIAVFRFNGTGFDGYYQVTTAHTISGPSAGTVVRTEVYQPGKALWDWMQLLIIPAVLVVGGFLLNDTTSKTEREAAEKRDQTERYIALDNQREAAMKEYFDKLSELMLHENLLKSKPEAEVRKVARILTLTVLPRLDGGRKKSVLKFLYESELIAKGNMVIELAGADFSGVDLSGADLRNVVLHGAKLIGANLRRADLRDAVLIETIFCEADLTGAYLIGAYLNGADLRNANLTGAQLNEANLEMVILSGAKVTAEQLKKAKSLAGAGVLDLLNQKHA